MEIALTLDYAVSEKIEATQMVTILNVDIQSLTLAELLREFDEGVLVTPNVDHIMKLQKDQAFHQIYKEADWVVCDSKILYLASKFLGTPFREVVPGSSFLPAFYEYHKANKEVSIFLLGAKEGVAQKALENINKKVGRKIVVDAYSPSFGFEKNPEECQFIVDRILASGADTLVVGVGAPKQEKWIAKYKDQLPTVKRFLALGATIDFEAGHINRAPLIYQKLYIEWLYRLIKEPRRLFKRYFVDDTPFFWYVIQQKMGLYRNPFARSKKAILH